MKYECYNLLVLIYIFFGALTYFEAMTGSILFLQSSVFLAATFMFHD